MKRELRAPAGAEPRVLRVLADESIAMVKSHCQRAGQIPPESRSPVTRWTWVTGKGRCESLAEPECVCAVSGTLTAILRKEQL